MLPLLIVGGILLALAALLLAPVRLELSFREAVSYTHLTLPTKA